MHINWKFACSMRKTLVCLFFRLDDIEYGSYVSRGKILTLNDASGRGGVSQDNDFIEGKNFTPLPQQDQR